MKEFHIVSSSRIKGSHPAYFYNSPEYIRLIEDNSVLSFYLHSASDEIIARIHFQVQDERALSHWRAPFGFLETVVYEDDILGTFWEKIEVHLKEEGCKEIKLISWPSFYDSVTSDYLKAFFLKQDFQILFTDHNFHIPVSKEIDTYFLKPEKKRLRKCKREGLTAGEWSEPPIEQVHGYLLLFRQQRNIPLNISKEQLIRSFRSFPDKYRVFVVKHDTRVVGVSVCVEVNKEIYYHFCLACDANYHTLSPSVMLYNCIYRYCQQKGYKWLDFGVASIKGIKQESLAQFKVNLGGILSEKPVFFKKLN